VFGRRLSHAGHSHHTQHPLRKRALVTIVAAAVLAALALLIAPPHAHGNFVYWSNFLGDSIGRAKINGTGANDRFITGGTNVGGVAVDSKFIYWDESGSPSSIGRANLDGSGVNHKFITTGVANPQGLAVTANGIYWSNSPSFMGPTTIGHANLDGSNPTQSFIDTGTATICGMAADQSFLYYLTSTTTTFGIGRAPLGGGNGDNNFIPLSSAQCGVAVDSSFLYWGTGDNTVGRVPVGGGTPQASFVSNSAGTTQTVSGVAVNPQYVFWGNNSGATSGNFIGRANIGGGSPNPTLIPGASRPFMLAAAPSNKITVDSVAKNKKKGTASINAKVSGPGQVTLNQTNTPPDVNAVASSVKQIGLTLTAASSFKLAVKPLGKTAKKLNKQIKKQLRKKRKAKAKVGVTVFIHFIPAGVAGVPNTQQVKVTLVRQRTKKK
jgi:hypothetical protein